MKKRLDTASTFRPTTNRQNNDTAKKPAVNKRAGNVGRSSKPHTDSIGRGNKRDSEHRPIVDRFDPRIPIVASATGHSDVAGRTNPAIRSPLGLSTLTEFQRHDSL